MLGGDCDSFGDEIGSGNNWEDWACSGNSDESEPLRNGFDWSTFGKKSDSVEPDGESVKVDLRERCSSGIGGLAPAKEETSGGKERGACEDLGISVWIWGKEGEDTNLVDPWSGFDL